VPVYWIFWPLRVIKIRFLNKIGYDISREIPEIKKFIENHRVLILGSGPSAKDLKNLGNKKIKLFTCNASPKILQKKEIKKKISLYLCTGDVLFADYKDRDLLSLFQKTPPEVFITDSKRRIEKTGKINMDKVIFVKDCNSNNFYLKRLISPKKINQIKGNSFATTSSGVRLLQYALYFGAKEIYLLGIDGGMGNYYWGGKNEGNHQEIDNNFLEIISKKYKNIYSASKSSPITKYFPYKRLGT